MATKELKVRPSGLERAFLCPGSVKMEEPFPWVDSPAAERGRKLHEAMALLFQAGEKAWDTIAKNPAITQEEVVILKECHKLGMSQWPDDKDTKVLVEHQLDMGFLGLVGGKPDLFYVSPKFKTAVLIDWKFGVGSVEDPALNWQMRAYGLGILESSKTDLIAVEPIIIQPSSWKADDKVRAHAWKKEELQALVPEIKRGVALAKSPQAPRVAGDIQCHFCKAKEVCAEYKVLAAQKKEMKDIKTEAGLQSIQTGTKLEVLPDMPLVAPVVIMDAETIKLAEEKKALMKSMTVTDVDTANAVGKLSKDIRALHSLIEANRKKVKDPFFQFGKKIDAEAEKALAPLAEAAKFGDDLVDNWKKAEAAKAFAIQQAEEAKRREAEEAQRKAEAQERKKQDEADKAAREAQLALDRSATLKSKAARDKAEAEAKAAQERAKEAQRLADIETQKALDAQRRAKEAEDERVRASAPPPKIQGYRDKVDVTFQIPDFGKIPAGIINMVLLPNTKVIDQMIKTGAITEANAPWIVINREATVARSR